MLGISMRFSTTLILGMVFAGVQVQSAYNTITPARVNTTQVNSTQVNTTQVNSTQVNCNSTQLNSNSTQVNSNSTQLNPNSTQVNSNSTQVNSTVSTDNDTCTCVQVLSFRFPPGTEVISEIESIVLSMNLTAVSIVTGFGSLQEATLRFIPKSEKQEPKIKTYKENLALNALSGVFSPTYTHVHAVVSKSDGSTIAGGVVCLTVYHTVEVVLQVSLLENYYAVFDRSINAQVLGVN